MHREADWDQLSNLPAFIFNALVTWNNSYTSIFTYFNLHFIRWCRILNIFELPFFSNDLSWLLLNVFSLFALRKSVIHCDKTNIVQGFHSKLIWYESSYIIMIYYINMILALSVLQVKKITRMVYILLSLQLSRIEITCQLMSLNNMILWKYSVLWQLFSISCHVDNLEITNRNRSLIFCFQSQCDKQPRDFQVWPYSWNLIACKYNKDDIILLLVTVPKECFIMQGDRTTYFWSLRITS